MKLVIRADADGKVVVGVGIVFVSGTEHQHRLRTADVAEEAVDDRPAVAVTAEDFGGYEFHGVCQDKSEPQSAQGVDYC